jgi:hypothetical protein
LAVAAGSSATTARPIVTPRGQQLLVSRTVRDVTADADVTLDVPARTSSKISTAPDGSSPAQELDAPLLEQSNWVAYRLRRSWGPKTQNA